MAISVECDACGYGFNAAEKFAGKLVKCPECAETIRVGGDAGGSGARSRPRRTETRRERPTRDRSERPSPRSRKRNKKSAANNNLMIGGGVVIVALLGVIIFLLMRGDGEEKIVDGNPPPAVEPSKTLNAERQAIQNEANQAKVASSKELQGPYSARHELLEQKEKERDRLKKPFAPDPTQNLAPVIPRTGSSTIGGVGGALSGDRVAWLFRDGTGFAKKDDMWVYSGDASIFGAGRSQKTTLTLYETMRTTEFVELFSQDLQARIRLLPTEFQIYSLAKRTMSRRSGGTLLNSTRTAGAWLGAASLPSRDQWTPIEPDPNNLPPLISAVKKQVARIDVQYEEGSGNGSGFLVDEGGRIVTNYHVIEEGKAARAVFCDAGPNGEEIEVPVVGFLYADPKRDIAVLQAVLPKGFRHRGLPLGFESQQGEKVVAFGAPLGLDSTATDGTISGHRSSEDLHKMIGVAGFKGNWLQTSTPISPGNSGGPLVNLSGEVLAINTMTLTKGQQLNFAISAADIKDALEKSEPLYKALSPEILPVASHRRVSSSSPGGRPRRSGRQIRISVGLGRYIPLWPIEGTPEAAEHLTNLEEVVVDVVTARRTIKTGMEDAARDAIREAGIKTVIDEGPILLVVPQLTQASSTSYELEVFAHLYVSHRGELLRIWRGSENIGRMSTTLLRKGMGKNMKKKVQEFFEDLTGEIKKAKESVAAEEEKERKEKDPFKDRVNTP